MVKYIVGIIALLVIGGGYYVWSNMGEEAAPVTSTPQIPTQVATTTYATSTYSITYPQNFTKDENYSYMGFEKKPIAGVKFQIPLTMATGTNLSSDTYLSIESLPRAKNCTGDIYIPSNVKAAQLTEGTMVYSVATSSEAGAGNVYEEYVYALSGSQPCVAVRYFIHSTSVSNYDPGTIREFDRSALMVAFDEIRRTLTLTR